MQRQEIRLMPVETILAYGLVAAFLIPVVLMVAGALIYLSVEIVRMFYELITER